MAATYLTRSSPNTLTGYILYSDRALYPLWGNLEAAIREGTNRWEQTFGGEASIFEHFFRTEEARRDFLSGMNGFGQLSSPAVVAAFDLGRFRRLVDLGGGTGHLALTACARYPQLQGAVFDLPAAISTAREYVGRDTPGGRLALIAGDFFTDPLPEADIFALGRILHDWSEDKIRTLLRKVWERLPSGRRAPDCRKAPQRRQDRSRAGADAIAQHAGLHRRQGAHPGRIHRPAARSRLYPKSRER